MHYIASVTMGGEPTFAMGASQECESLGSRHSDNRETGFLSEVRKAALSPLLPRAGWLVAIGIETGEMHGDF